MCAAFKIYNATELWQRENSVPSVPSFSQSLDNILGHNGLRLCSLTEVLGLPGTGKTQLCLQLCASIQIPTVLGGLNSEALYIDTNTNFTVERFREILRASISRCQQLLDIPFKTREEDALKKLHYVNALGIEKFCAFILRLPKIIEEKSNEGVSARQRTGLLFRLMADLQRLAVDKQIAVLLTNEMSTRVGLSSGSVVGALGDAWAHRCNTRVLLAADPADPAARLAVLLKSPNTPGCVTRFQITHDGIRDVQ
ncbi:DNA repair protein RAD51 homolog 3-like isoform X2 [Pectinophora gossypiella]|uniref:DNA repair protein RAD51 homolog 3-like isoform X2 n=1 Tax=Pectinophora gossypiella TaxID=13191 RepID=UPI00214E9F09|nr:DNA repair protein RAD51 homolog 3-like isoform X2 [Pectinophora gossypiella]